MQKKKRIFIFIFLFFVIAVFPVVYFSNRAIDNAAKDKLYSDAENIPFNKTGILLGTSKFLKAGHFNPYYVYRIDATLALFRANKIRYVIISGDNSRKSYNEPALMREDLIKGGIDSTHIFLDYAGFRTFDSMVRAREIFGQDSLTVISQQFHNERALFIASHEGITAIGFNAKDVNTKMGLRTQIREKFARVKVFLDYLTGKEPKFLGPKINIPAS